MRSLRVLLPCLSSALALALAACVSPPRALRWEVVGGEPRRADVASWRAFVAPGGCAWTSGGTIPGLDGDSLDAGALDAGAVAYDQTASSLEMLAAPPELAAGRWSFHLVGRDADGRVLTAGCTTETLPLQRDARVTVRLEPAFLAPGDGLTSIRFCAVWSELGCRNGDDDCDGVSDCLDADCATSGECACTADRDCGDCLECDVAAGVCRPLRDGESCGAGEGSCVSGSCCLGCVTDDGRCREGAATLACGTGGQRCEECPCGCEDGRCIPCSCVEGAPCWDGAGTCHAGACCTGCFEAGVCQPGDTDDACGAAGASCTRCPCGCVDGECARCECDAVFDCAVGECRDGRCCAPAPAAPDAVSVSVGRGYACVVDPDEGTRCFGEGSRGQLGLGDTNDGSGFLLCPLTSLPCSVPWLEIATGTTHSCGVREYSTTTSSYPRRLACWGGNEAGQLGNSTTAPVVVPTYLPGGSSHFTTAAVLDVAVGDSFSCAIVSSYIGNDAALPRDAGVDLDEGAVWCWGSFLEGRLGRGSAGTANAQSPVPVFTNAASLTAGRAHVCALSRTGVLSCWGANNLGQVTGLSGGAVSVPTRMRTEVTWVAVEAGEEHTCGVFAEGGRYWIDCWGANDYGQLLSRQGPFTTIPQLALGDAHTCFLASGALRCVGRVQAFGDTPADMRDGGLDARVDAGAFDASIDAGRLSPIGPASLPTGRLLSVAAGGGATCVVVDDVDAGGLWCAGDLDCPGGGCRFTRVCLPPFRPRGP